MKINRIAIGLAGCLVFVFVGLVAVALVNGIALSGDLTYGDLLVGLGTFALATLTAVLADATFAVDRRAAERDQRELEREVRGISRLIDAELEIVQKSWEAAEGAGVWKFNFAIPHGALDRYAAVMLQSDLVSATDGLDLVRFFTQLTAWDLEVAMRSADQIGPVMNVGPNDTFHHEFVALRQPLSNARRILHPLAYAKG